MILFSLQLLVDFNRDLEAQLLRNKYLVVKFCSEDCDFCKTFDSVFDDVAVNLEHVNVVLGNFNCRTDPYICKKYGVKEHPWIAIFKDHKLYQWYYGPRQHNVIEDWIIRWTNE